MRPILRTGYAAAALACACLLPGLSARSAQAGPNEARLKAAIIYNLAKYVTWPGDTLAQGQITLCAFGKDEAEQALDEVDGRQAQGMVVRVRKLRALDEIKSCHVVYLAASEYRASDALARAAANLPALTVSERDAFAESGGMIGLVTVDERIRFDINVAAAQKNRLAISSNLLKLARNVIGVH
ncbi:MAG: YfiR family protein [Rhodocyclaceae bacterium]|nr:YfiR family protein [Rhodocyclaceae bacterium]